MLLKQLLKIETDLEKNKELAKQGIMPTAIGHPLPQLKSRSATRNLPIRNSLPSPSENVAKPTQNSTLTNFKMPMGTPRQWHAIRN